MSLLVHVSDIKQFFYCPRIIFFNYCQPVERKISYKMEAGKETHDILSELEERRTLKRYGLDKGKRLFKVSLSSEKLHLNGVLDLLIHTEQGFYPIEFKNTEKKQVAEGHRCQLSAYACLVEEEFRAKVDTGFIYFIPDGRIASVEINDKLKEKAKWAICEIRRIVECEVMPSAPASKAKCVDCEFLRYCGDRY